MFPGETLCCGVRVGFVDVMIDALNRGLVEKMIEDGYAMVSSTVMNGRTVLRLCTNNPRTTEEDIRKTIQRLERFGKELSFRAEQAKVQN